MAAINFNNEKSIKASFTKEKTINTNVTSLSYIPAYKEYEKERQENELERQAFFEEFQNRVNSGEFEGKDGRSLEYDWNGTKLGIRQEGESSFEYVNLKGEKGEKGESGDGVIEAITNLEIEEMINKNI